MWIWIRFKVLSNCKAILANTHRQNTFWLMAEMMLIMEETLRQWQQLSWSILYSNYIIKKNLFPINNTTDGRMLQRLQKVALINTIRKSGTWKLMLMSETSFKIRNGIKSPSRNPLSISYSKCQSWICLNLYSPPLLHTSNWFQIQKNIVLSKLFIGFWIMRAEKCWGVMVSMII